MGNAETLLIVGAGGHARVIADIATRQGQRVLGFLDDRVTGRVDGYTCLGPISHLREIASSLADQSMSLVIGIGDNATRLRLVQEVEPILNEGHFVYSTVIDPSAVISDHAEIGPGTVVMPNAVVNTGARIGSHVIINTTAAVDHDCVVCDFAHLSPGVRLAGNVYVGKGAHMGTGAVAIPGVRIGAWSVVGAGSVVVSEIPDRVVAYGVPAKVRRSLL